MKKKHCAILTAVILSVLSCQKLAQAGNPSLQESHINMNLSQEQCKAKATEVSNLVFSRVGSSYSTSTIFRISGTTSTVVGFLYCLKQGSGSRFVVYTSGGWDDRGTSPKINQRIFDYMLRK